MAYDFNVFKKASETVFEWLKKEYSVIRASEASPTILDGVLVEAYGSKMPLNQAASILATGPKSLVVTPWDKNLAAEIDRAIRESNLGLSVALDSQGIRISFPELTSERRLILTKTVKEKLEEARIKIRSEREKILNDLDKKIEAGTLSKDDKFRLKNDLQKLVDDSNNLLEGLASKKEKEILE